MTQIRREVGTAFEDLGTVWQATEESSQRRFLEEHLALGHREAHTVLQDLRCTLSLVPVESHWVLKERVLMHSAVLCLLSLAHRQRQDLP